MTRWPAHPPARQACRRGPLAALLLGILAPACGPAEVGRTVDTGWIEYPAARRADQVDAYHGVQVADPYRWLEDESSGETRAWLAAQERIAGRLFARIPAREDVISYLEGAWLDGVVMVPVRRGENTFFFRAAEGKPHHVLYVQRGQASEPEVVFDLNQSDPDGLRSTEPAITVSPGGRYVGYPIHHAGADAARIHFFDTRAFRSLDEVIPESYAFVTDWLPDETGFFYTYVDLPTMAGQATDKKAGIYRHRMGTAVEEDILIYDRPWQGRYMATAHVADDSKHLLIHDMNIMGSRGGWGVRSLEEGAGARTTWLIEPEAEHRFAYVGSAGSELFLCTDHGSPNWRIVAMDLTRPGIDNLREVVPEQPEPISMTGGTNEERIVLHEGRLYVTYVHHNAHRLRIFDLDGRPGGEIALPFPGRVSEIRAMKGDPRIFIGLQSFLEPQSAYAYDTGTEMLAPLEAVARPARFDDYKVSTVFYPSRDGTQVPMSIIAPKGAARDGRARVMLYGYGGWGIPLLPRFDNRIHAWLHMGGVYAVANLRGGGEYGDAWHQAGQFFAKQNVFDDFAAAAEYLVREGYTTHSRISIVGRSNGGLLTAVCYNQHPELFGAVISEIAAIDMLRIQNTPIGATVDYELGNPAQSREMFEYLLGYSPLHNVRHEGPYPPILNMVGENDPRCKPGHIYKFVAELQRMGDPGRVAILRLVRGAGHGSLRKDENLEWIADEVTFAWAMTG